MKSITDGTQIGVMSFDPSYQAVIAESGQAVWYDRGRKVRSLGSISEVIDKARKGQLRVTLAADLAEQPKPEKLTIKPGLPLRHFKEAFFSDLAVGTVFVYRASGPVRAKNIFTKVEPYTASAPNAKGVLSDKLKLWFEQDARILVLRDEWECRARPAALDGKPCAAINEGGKTCSECGCTRHASDLRAAKEQASLAAPGPKAGVIKHDSAGEPEHVYACVKCGGERKTPFSPAGYRAATGRSISCDKCGEPMRWVTVFQYAPTVAPGPSCSHKRTMSLGKGQFKCRDCQATV